MSPASPVVATTREPLEEIDVLRARSRVLEGVVDELASRLALSPEALDRVSEDVAMRLALLRPVLLSLSDDIILCVAQYLDLKSTIMVSRTCVRIQRCVTELLPKTGYMRRAALAVTGVVDESFNPNLERRWRAGGPLVFAMKAHNGSIMALARAVKDDGRELVLSATDDGSVVVWNLERSRAEAQSGCLMHQHHLQSREANRLHAMHGHSGAVFCVAADGPVVVSGGYDRTLKLWDLATGDCRATLRGHESWVSSVAVDASRGVALSGAWDATIRVWDLARCTQIGALPTAPNNSVYALDWDCRTGMVAAGCHHRAVELFDAASQQRTGTLAAAEQGDAQRRCYAVKLVGDTVVSGWCDAQIRLWDARAPARAPMGMLTGHTKAVLGVHASESRPFRVVSCSADRLVCVHDTRMARGLVDEGARYLAMPSAVSTYALSAHSSTVFACLADRDKVISGGEDSILRVFRFD